MLFKSDRLRSVNATDLESQLCSHVGIKGDLYHIAPKTQLPVVISSPCFSTESKTKRLEVGT